VFSLKRQIYERTPSWVARTICMLPFPALAGRAYRTTVARGEAIDRASRAELRSWQEESLGAMLRFAAAEVPAYQHLQGVVSRLSAFEALKAFPLIDKDVIQADVERFLPRCFRRIAHYAITTGGTSGNQLKFFVDDNSHSIETAFMHRQWARVGYHWRNRKATLRGVEFSRMRRGEYWQFNPVYNELQLSPFHLNRATISAYVEALARFEPEFIHGYPSSVAMLASLAEQEGLSLHTLRLRSILLGSEQVFADQRTVIERACNARAFSWYGHSERVILAGECECGDAYHHFPDYGILEMVAVDGDALVDVGERGELVGTGLHNRSMPLIRYRTGDVARRLSGECRCGRAFDRFDQVEGRWGQEYVVGANGTRIYTTALNMHGPYFDKVNRYQYVQRTPGQVDLRLMVADAFSRDDLATLKEAFGRKLGVELRVDPVLVADIPLTSRGKLRRVVRLDGSTSCDNTDGRSLS
jgi:phenylacetate-CoA ligase